QRFRRQRHLPPENPDPPARAPALSLPAGASAATPGEEPRLRQPHPPAHPPAPHRRLVEQRGEGRGGRLSTRGRLPAAVGHPPSLALEASEKAHPSPASLLHPGRHGV